MEHKVIVIASGKFGIQQLVFQIDFGGYAEVTGHNLTKKLMSRALMAGYTSILGVKSIDYINEAAIIFRDAFREFPAYCQSIVRKLDQILRAKEEMDRLSDSQEERRAFLTKLVNANIGYIRNSYDALALCGIDVDDSASKRNVLNNLGFNRTDM